MNRRDMLKVAGTAYAGATLLGAEAFASEPTSTPNRKKKALIIGAHPDDPELCCGGTMIRLKQAGWDVVSVYMTKGEAGIKGKSHEEAVAIRTKEATNACNILGVRPIFMTQIDGSSEVNKERYAEMLDLVAAEKPDIVFTHWPLDSHADHRVCAILVYNAWRRLDYSFELYYAEGMNGTQTAYFHPTDYVDISSVAEQKRKACNCHTSQDMEPLYQKWHDPIEKFRGIEFRCDRAEAYIHIRRDTSDIII